MTQKEKLAHEYIELKKQFDGENFKEGWTQNQVWYLAKTLKVVDLTQKIEAVKNAIAQKELRLKKEAWCATPEGMAYIQVRKDRLDEIYGNIHAMIDEARIHTSKIVKELLGEQWDVTSFSDGRMEIAIVKEYREDGRPVELFGHDFDVFFGKDWHEDEYRWEMNYGTMGAFDMSDKSSTRVQFLIGIGKFLSDTEIIPTLCNYLHMLVINIHAMDKERWALEDEIKNPKMD